MTTPHAQGKILVLTDSTASLPAELAAESGIEVVNLHVLHDGKSFEENVEISAAQCASLVSQHTEVATSQPSLQAFEQAFERAEAAGYVGVVVACISAKLSGTFSTASMAAQRASLPVEVIDSGTSAMALGLACVAGARVANSGGSLQEVAGTVRGALARSGAFFMVDSLDHLRRGGRLSAAAAAIGTVLGMKPILTINPDGNIEVHSKVRSRNAALKALRDMAQAVADSGDVVGVGAADVGGAGADADAAGIGAGVGQGISFGVHYFGDDSRAQDLASRIGEATGKNVYVSPVSAVLGVHVGPGLVALTYA